MRMFSCAVILFCGVFFGCACWLSTVKTVVWEREFYFVTSASENVQASLYTVTMDGGAGFPIEDKDMYHIAYSVYFTQDTALSAAYAVQAFGEDVKIIKRSTGKLYFKGRKEKKQKSKTLNALKGLENCMQLLQTEIKRLEDGTTQQASKRRIKAIIMQLRCLADANMYISTYAQGCQVSAERLERSIKEIVFVKTLRFELCNLSETYLKTCEKFYF